MEDVPDCTYGDMILAYNLFLNTVNANKLNFYITKKLT
jgi:hypothetical protein